LERRIACTSYALVTDRDLVAIADSDIEDIGIDYSEDAIYQATLRGGTLSDHWYYEKLDETVVELSTPLIVAGQIDGIVAIGISQKELRANSFLIAVVTFLSTMLVSLGYLLVQRKNVMKPINRLCRDIGDIDLEDEGKLLQYHKDFILFGVYESIADLLARFRVSVREIGALNREIKELAYQDYLTKLPNRFSFVSSFQEMLNEHKHIAVVMLDLDNFKEYNDTKGHIYGDGILVSIGKRIGGISNGNIRVSRFGGDEFLLAIGFEQKGELMASLARVEQLFTEPLQFEDELVTIEASGGVSLYPEDGEELEGLIMDADMAMYEAKASGRSHITFFKGDMKTEKARSRHIKTNLQEAMGNDGFKLFYQPVMDVLGNAVAGYEALLRFKDRDIYPDEFIPVAESTGLIIPIGRWVVESAIKQIARWRSRERKCTSVSVNLSARQFHDNEIIGFIAQKLDHYDVPGDLLTIEVTETFLLEKDVEETRTFLNALKALGIHLALDDFGTGFTSLMFFEKFPFDHIKLDRSFILSYTTGSNVDIFKKWMLLFKEYGYLVVAEGVETETQCKVLKELGVDYMQGYYFSRPVEVESI